MAISTEVAVGETIAIAAPGTSVAPTLDVPDNCNEIVMLNLDSTETVYVGLGTPGGAVAPGSALFHLIPGLAPGFVWTIGVLDTRPGTVTDAAKKLVFDATGACNVRVTYLNHISDHAAG